jgi:hypothetical protein
MLAPWQLNVPGESGDSPGGGAQLRPRRYSINAGRIAWTPLECVRIFLAVGD